MQSWQPVLPLCGENLPAGQSSHVACLGCDPNEPGKHALSDAEPIAHAKPAPHAMQSSALVITASDEFIRVPPGHGSGAAEPSVQ